MTRRLLLPLIATAALAGVPTTAAAEGPTATASKSCKHSAKVGRSFGPTYVTNVTASGTSCKKARKLIKAYHSAGAGNRTVKGYKCTSKRLATSPVQYDARVTCKNGGKRVGHIFTQNT